MITYTPNQSFFSEIKKPQIGLLRYEAEVSLGLSSDKCSDKAVVAITYRFKSYFFIPSAYD